MLRPNRFPLPSLVLLLALVPSAPSPQQASTTTERVRRELDGGRWVEEEVEVGSEGAPVRHGAYDLFAADGERLVRGTFEHGQREGTWRWYDAAGELRVRGIYRAGLRDGRWSFQDPEGRDRASGKYEQGRLEGKWEFYSADGAVLAAESGEFTYAEAFDADGLPLYQGYLLDGRLHGPWRVWWPTGAQMVRAEFARARPCGEWEFTHFDGTRDDGFALQRFPPAPASLQLLQDGLEIEVWTDTDLPREGPEPLPSSLRPAPLQAPVERRDPEASARTRSLVRRALAVPPGSANEPLRDLIAERRDGLLDALHAMQDLDLEDEDEVKAAWTIIWSYIETWSGRSYGWRTGVSATDVEANRLSLLRWTSCTWLAEATPVRFGLIRHLPSASGEGEADKGNGSDSQRIEVPVAGLLTRWGLTATGRAMPVRYAARFDRRRPLRSREAAAEALDEGLAWLAAHQGEDGAWSASGFGVACDCDGSGLEHDVGVTSLALLAFLGAGNTAYEGPHANVVARGLDYLYSLLDPATGHIGTYVGGNSLHEHALATEVLCEVAALTPSHQVGDAASRAILYLLRARSAYLAWRYGVPSNEDNDTCVTGAVVAALSAAETAGLLENLEPSRGALEGALAWIDQVSDPGTGRVGYDKMDSRSVRYVRRNARYPTDVSECMTAVGLLSRLRLGQRRAEIPILEKHAELLLRTLPEWDPKGFGNDLYAWYHGVYALQALDAREYGDPWREALWEALLEGRSAADDHEHGSLDPNGPWGMFGGRVYSTALMCLCLEVEFRYTWDE